MTANEYTRVCLKCGKKFELKHRKFYLKDKTRGRYCSNECRASGIWTKERRERMSATTKENIKKGVITGVFKKGRKSIAWNKGLKKEEGNNVGKGGYEKGHTLSKESIEKMKNSIRIGFIKGRKIWCEGKKGLIKQKKGKDNPLWKGNRTKNKIIRQSTEFKSWRDSVFKRDNYTCKKCNNFGKVLNAHHIINFSSFPEGRLEIENGVTLCHKCHKNFHKVYGIKNNTIKQLKEFIKI